MNKLLAIFILAIFITGCNNEYDGDAPSTENNECVEPQNPYDDDSGHYAGFEWAAENNEDCNGSSDSFDEGCEEYFRQLNEYNKCISKKS